MSKNSTITILSHLKASNTKPSLEKEVVKGENIPGNTLNPDMSAILNNILGQKLKENLTPMD